MQSQGIKGVVFVLVSMLIFSSVNSLVKDSVQYFPIWELVFARMFFASIPALGLLTLRGELHTLFKIKDIKPFFILGVGVAIALFFLFLAFRHMPLADATSIGYSAILFITLFSWPLLKEPVGWRRGLAIAIGFVGVLIVAEPSGNFSWYSLSALSFALLDALLLIMTRILGQTYSAAVIAVYVGIIGGVTGGIMMIPDFVLPEGKHLWSLLVLGLGAGVGQLFINQGFRIAPAVVVGPMIYSSIIWGALFGFVFFGESPKISFYAGSFVLISAGLYIIFREARMTRSAA